MNLYLLTQEINNSYDTYDSMVVAAKTEEQAQLILPRSYMTWEEKFGNWAYRPEEVKVKLIGKAIKGTEAGVILASFNAG